LASQKANFYVCEYSPAGNVIGQFPYVISLVPFTFNNGVDVVTTVKMFRFDSATIPQPLIMSPPPFLLFFLFFFDAPYFGKSRMRMKLLFPRSGEKYFRPMFKQGHLSVLSYDSFRITRGK
jgi:hypothetical protein